MKNKIKQLNKLLTTEIKVSPKELLDELRGIIEFEEGEICLNGQSKLKGEYILENNLCCKNATFGKIKIKKSSPFNKEDKEIFNLCTSIIANKIKDSELSKIIQMQIAALQEGISEKNRAYITEKSKNDFFANFSHELRTPLNSVISSSELLNEEIFGSLNEKQKEYVNDIQTASLHLLGMINDILDMAKLEANSMLLNPTEFELTDLSQAVCNIIKPLAQKKGTQIIKKYKNITVKADYQKIQQIMFNLLSNAIKYTPQNGKVTISLTDDDKNFEISVKDTGIGIDKKYHKKIFEKFAQIGSEKNSNGLGLTIIKELVKLHGGKIKLKSELGKGSEFIISLPKIK